MTNDEDVFDRFCLQALMRGSVCCDRVAQIIRNRQNVRISHPEYVVGKQYSQYFSIQHGLSYRLLADSPAELS